MRVHQVSGIAGGRVFQAQQGGAHAAGHGRVGVDQRMRGAVVQHLGLGLQQGQPLPHRLQLRAADQRAHAHGVMARVAHRGFGQTGAERSGDLGGLLLGHQHASDGGAFLPGFHGHLARHFLDQQVQRLGAGTGQEPGRVQAVGLDVHAHRQARDGRVRADQFGRLGRAGEGQHVKRLELIEQASRGPADHRQRARRQHARVDHVLDHALREPGGGGGRLDDDGHAREQRRRGLFPQAPAGEVEGVDEQRHAACGHQHVLGLEQRVFSQAAGLAVHQVAPLAQAFAHLGVLAQGEDAAVNVHGRVVLHRAAVGGGDLVVGVAVGLQHLDHGRQHLAALRVAQRPQGGAASLTRKGKGRGQVQAGGVHADQLGAQHRVEQHGACARAALPAAGHEVGEQFGHGVFRGVDHWVNSMRPWGSRYSTSARPALTVGRWALPGEQTSQPAGRPSKVAPSSSGMIRSISPSGCTW